MSDRSSAYIFGMAFNLIADHVPAKQKKTIAKKFWKESLQYDFSPDQMHADKALMRLGLAKKAVDPNYPDEGKVTLYFGDEGF